MAVKKIEGKSTSALIFTTDNEKTALDQHAEAQIQMLCDTECCAGNVIRVMPDVHAGKVGPIGLTMTLNGKAMPAIVSGDIGCGLLAVPVKGKMEFQKLDAVLRDRVPSGSANRGEPHPDADDIDLSELRCASHIQLDRAYRGLGTLGGGNHFIEIDENGANEKYLVIHSGSRNLGQQVCDYYMKAGQEELKAKGVEIPFEMTWLEGQLFEDYLHDVQFVCRYAVLNRQIMMKEITKGMKWKTGEELISIHNYIGDDGILRKGAISAKEGESVIIPMNMRDGVILGTGKGNAEWNQSAPHGSGRVLMRTEVKTSHTVSEFKKEMKGIYSSCIRPDTLDEAPFAYRSIEEMKPVLKDTVEITDVLHPLYSFKAGDEK